MKISAIDIGTNSIRLLNTTIEKGQITGGEKQLEMTRIGEGVNETGRLSPAAIERSLDALRVFHEQAKAYGSEHIYAMATSAVRDASNRAEFLLRAEREVGLTIDVLSGEEEAEVGYLGVLAGQGDFEGNILVIDVGGGSTELIVGDKRHILFGHSIDMGAVRMTGKHIKKDPPSNGEINAVRKDIRGLVRPMVDIIEQGAPVRAVGIGGTATTLGAIQLKMEIYDRARIQKCVVDLSSIEGMVKRFKSMPLDQRREIQGLQPKRADIILSGAMIIEEVLTAVGIDQLHISDWDNLEGYLMKKHLKG